MADDGVNVGDGYIEIHPDLDNAKLAAIEAALKARLGAAGDNVRIQLNDNISRGLGDSRNFDSVTQKMRTDIPQIFEGAGTDSGRAFHRGFFTSILSDFNRSGGDAGRSFASSFGNSVGASGDDSPSGTVKRVLGKVTKDAGDAGDDSGRSFASRMRLSTTSVFGEANGIFGFLTSPAGLAAAGVAGVILGSALAATITSTLGLGAIGLAFVALHNDPNIKLGLNLIKNTVLEEGKKLAEPFRLPFIEALGTINSSLQQVMPQFTEAMTIMANSVKPLSIGLAGFLEQLQPGLSEALKNAEPIVAELGKQLPGLGKAIGDFFAIISQSQGQIDGLRILFKIIEGILYGLAYLISGLAATLNGFVTAGRYTVNFFKDEFAPFFVRLAGWFAGPFLTPFLAVASFFTGPFLGPFRAVADFFTGSFLTPFLTLSSFFQGSFLTPFRAVADFFTGSFLTPFKTVAEFFAGPFAGFFVSAANIIASVAQTVFNGLLLPIFRGLLKDISILGDAVRFFGEIFVVAFEGLKILVTPVINAIRQALDILGQAISLFYTQNVKPVLDAVGRAFSTVFSAVAQATSFYWGIITTIFDAALLRLKVGVEVTLGAVYPVWRTIWGGISTYFGDRWREIQTVFNAVMGIIETTLSTALRGIQIIWNATWAAMFAAVKQRIDQISSALSVVWSFIAGLFKRGGDDTSGLWSKMWSGIVSVTTAQFDRVKSKISTTLDLIVSAFKIAKSGIETAWSAIGDAVKKPINFIIDPVYKHGIEKVFNLIASKAGIKERLPDVDKLAGGGPIRGGSGIRDDVPVLAMAGEHMLTQQEVAAMGGHENVFAFRKALTQGRGGKQGQNGMFDLGGIIGDIGKAIGDGAGSVGKFTRGLLSGAAGLAFKPVRSLLDLIPGAGMIHDGAKGLGNKLIDGILDFIKGDDAAHAPKGVGGAAGRSIANDIAGAAALSGNLGTWISEAMKYVNIEWISGLTTLIMRESGGNPRSINLWDINAQHGDPSGGLMQTIGATFRANRDPRLPNDMFDPVANIVAGMNYVHGRYGSLHNVQQAHAELPPLGYDSGGLLKPGTSLVHNGTGQPETIRTAEQEANLRNNTNVHIHFDDEALRGLIRVEIEDNDGNLSAVLGSGRRRQ